MSLGSNLVALRKKAGLTRVQLAEEMNIPSTTLRNYEQDDREPGHKFLVEIAKRFDVTVDYLLDNEKAPETEVSEAQEKSSIVSALTNMLQSAGWIGEGGDISDEDWRFLRSVAAMLDSYFEEKR